jgi:hypothetical protein
LKVDDRVVVGVQRTAIRKEDFDAAGLRAHAIPGQQGHRCGSIVTTTVSLEDDRTVNEGNMRGRGVAAGFLAKRRNGAQAQYNGCKGG